MLLQQQTQRWGRGDLGGRGPDRRRQSFALARSLRLYEAKAVRQDNMKQGA